MHLTYGRHFFPPLVILLLLRYLKARCSKLRSDFMSKTSMVLMAATAIVMSSHCIARADGTNQNIAASPWSMSVSNYAMILNRVILKDTRGVHSADMQQCKKTAPDEYICGFRDTAFNNSVADFKSRNLMNGSFTQQLGIAINTKHGKLSRIQLFGTREDPANMFAFLGTIFDIIQTFDPSVGSVDGDLKRVGDELGLMRGDSAADIGKPRVMIEDWGAVNCLSQPSTETMHETCVVEPRS